MQLVNPSNAKTDSGNHGHYLIQRSVFAMDFDDIGGETEQDRAKVVRTSRQVVFQMAEVAMARELYRDILNAIERLRLTTAMSG